MNILKKAFNCFFCWRPNLPHWSDDAQVICAVTFGRGDDRCNAAMAEHVLAKIDRYHLPFCVQAEIKRYIGPDFIGFVSMQTSDTHSVGYVGTNETVQEQAEQYLLPRGKTKIHVEAHPDHAWRVIRCYHRRGIEVVSLCSTSKPYPSASRQTWCRSRFRFIPYEILVRLYYLAKGYI